MEKASSRNDLRVSASFDGEVDENSPLKLSPAPTRPTSEGANSFNLDVRLNKRDVVNAVTNIINTILGGGLLALPFALKNCGVVFGSLLLVLFFFLARYTSSLIITCAQMGKGVTLADMADSAFGGGGRVLVEVSLILFSYGALVGYLVIIGDIWTSYVNLLFPCDRRLVMLFFGALVCFPLSCLRRISLLRFTSYAALVLILYLVCCIVGFSVAGMVSAPFESSRVVIFSLEVQFLAVLPIISFAYSFQANVTPIWGDMAEFKTQSSRGINLSIWISCFVCLVVYLLVGIFGYLSFYEKTSDNILVHFPASLWYFDIGKIGYSLIIMFSYPLLAFPMRIAIDSLVNVYYYKDPLRVVSTFRLILVSAIIFVLAYALAAVAIGIGVVFGISGATVGNLVVLGLPAALYIALDVDPREGSGGSRPWWFYRVFSLKKTVPIIVFLLSLVLTVTGLLAVISFSLLDGFGQTLTNK